MKQKKLKKTQKNITNTTLLTRAALVLPPCILALVTWLFYFPSLSYEFQFDDLSNIKMFYGIRHKTISDLFFSGTRWVSAWLNTIFYKISVFEPYAYRTGNVIFHTITGILIYTLTIQLLNRVQKSSFFYKNRLLIATLTGGLFLLHPVQTQTVSYVIQGQLEGLAGLFVILMSVLFVCATTTQSKTKAALLTGALYTVAFLGCGTKEIFIITPALLLLIDWFFIAQGSIKKVAQHWYIHIPVFLIIGTIYAYFLKPHYFAHVFSLNIVTHNNNGNILTEHFHQNITSLTYFISQFKVLIHYGTMFLWPFSISADYDWIIVKGFFAPDCLFPFIALALLLLFTFKRLQKNKTDVIAFGILWFFVSMLPRSSIIPSTELVADYKTYFASFGLLLLIGMALVWTIQKISTSKTTQWCIIIALILFYGLATYNRNKVWRSGEEFWWNVIERAPKKARAYNNYGTCLAKKEKAREAIPFFEQAIQLDHYYADPYNNLSVTYNTLGEPEKAIAIIERSIQINPHFPEGYNNLATALIAQKEYKRAKKNLKKAIKMRDHYGKAHFNLARVYYFQHKKEKSLKHFKYACCNADFDNATGFNTYAKIAAQQQEYDQAIFAYKKLCQLEPGSYDHILDLANTYYFKKDFLQAENLYKQLTKNNPNDGRAYVNLAELVFSEKKNYKKALDLYICAEKHNHQNPLIPVRKAICYKKMGQREQAKKILQECTKSRNTQVRLTARQELRTMNT